MFCCCTLNVVCSQEDYGNTMTFIVETTTSIKSIIDAARVVKNQIDMLEKKVLFNVYTYIAHIIDGRYRASPIQHWKLKWKKVEILLSMLSSPALTA